MIVAEIELEVKLLQHRQWKSFWVKLHYDKKGSD